MMQDPTHGYRISDFTEEDIDYVANAIEESSRRIVTTPMDWMHGYIDGLMLASSSQNDGSIPNYIVLLDIFWSYLVQGGHEGTTCAHIGLGPYTTTDCALELIDHLIDSERLAVDELLDYINKNMSKR